MQGLVGPDGVLLDVGPHVEVPVVPAKLDSGLEPRGRHALPLDVCWPGGHMGYIDL